MISNGGKSHGILYAFAYRHTTEVHLPSKNKLHACLQQEMGVASHDLLYALVHKYTPKVHSPTKDYLHASQLLERG